MSLEALAKAPLFAVTYKESLGISWEDLAEAILIEILATILIIPTATFLIIRFYQARKSGRIWSVSSVLRQTLSDRRAFPTIVISNSGKVEGDDGYVRHMTGVGQVRALARVARSLSEAYRAHIDSSRVILSNEYAITRDEFTEDLLVIGGPKTNEVAAAFLNGGLLSGVLPEGFSFDEETTTGEDGSRRTETVIRFPREPKPVRGQESKDPVYIGHARTDVIGVVVRCGNPLSSKNRVLTFVGGIGTHGTEAAAIALTEHTKLQAPKLFSTRWARNRFSEIKGNGYIAVISGTLRGDGNAQRVGSTRILEFRRIHWNVEDPR